MLGIVAILDEVNKLNEDLFVFLDKRKAAIIGCL